MGQDMEVVMKNGDIALEARISRSTSGVRLRIQAHPAVEGLIRGWGQGRPSVPLEGWTVEGQTNPYCHAPQYPLGAVAFPLGQYRMDLLGGHLLTPGANGALPTLNLSFLRIIGISQGITLYHNGVYSTDALATIANGVKLAVRDLCRHYLAPVDIGVTLTVKGVPT